MKGLAFLHVEGTPRASLEEARMLLRALESRFGEGLQTDWYEVAAPDSLASARRADAVFISELHSLEPAARRQLSWRLRRELAVPARVRPLRRLRTGPDVVVVSDDGEVEAADAQEQRIHVVTRVAAELAQQRWGLVTLVRPPPGGSGGVAGMESWEKRAREAAAQVPSLRCEVVELEEVLRRLASAPGSLDVILTEGRVADGLVQTQEAQALPEAFLGEDGRGLYPLNGQGPQGVLSVTLALRSSLRMEREAVGVERALFAAEAAQRAASGVEESRVWEAVRAHLISDVTTSLAI